VLRLIWQEREISRADIARRTDLSRSTVSEIVSLLLPTALVAEIGTGPSRGGRRPIVLRFQDEACTILGVEVGATHVAVALTDLRGKVLVWRHRQHAVRANPDGTRRLVKELCEACLEKSGTSTRRLIGVGIALPSPIDPREPQRLSEESCCPTGRAGMASSRSGRRSACRFTWTTTRIWARWRNAGGAPGAASMTSPT
jgi:hypothetical protein